MSGIFHEGRWYENTDMICRRCGRPVYDSDNPEYCYQCFHCDEDFYSFEVEEQDALYVEADSEQMNFYKDTLLKNDTVTGSGFPLLYPGDNTLSFSGGITALAVTPRWCTL